MVEIIERSKGRTTILSKIFDSEALRAFNSAAAEFQETGAVGQMEKFYNVQADGSNILAASERRAKDFNSALTSLTTTFSRYADSELSGPVRNLADALNALEPGTVERWLQVGKAVGLTAIAKRFTGPVGASAFAMHEYGMEPLGLGARGIWGQLNNLNEQLTGIGQIVTGKRDWSTGELRGEAPTGKIEISVTDDRLKVTRMQSDNLELDIDTGRMMR